MIKLDKRCKICKLIRAGDDKLLKRLYGSSAYRGRAGEPLTKILKAYEGQFNRDNLWRHTKKHQALSEEDIQANVQREIEKSAEASIAREVVDHHIARNLVIDKGYKAVKTGRSRVSTRDLLQATKQAADIEERQKDRSLKVVEMVFAFASGEIKPNDNLTGGDPAPGRSHVANTA